MFCLFLASSFTGIFAQQQSLQQQQIEKVEQKVQEFTKKNMQNVPQEQLMRFKNSFDLKEHGFLFKNLPVQEQEELLDYHKRRQLRTLYFKTFPDDRQVYAPEVAPVCLNGGFEDGNFNNYQGFSAEDDSSNNGGYDGGECTAVPVNGVGNFAWDPINLFGTTTEFNIVGAGSDPIIAANGANLSTVNPFNTDPTNNFAARINAATPCSPNHGIDRLVKPITLQESGVQEIRFYYALVSEFPDHTNANPFFTARALNAAGLEEDRMCVVSNPAGNPFFNEITNPQSPPGSCNFDTILWQDWTCATLEVSGNAGDVITLEFIMADCGAGAHFGYAYIDDICAESCEGGDNFQGSIELNPFDPCEVTFPFDVCADFIVPQLNGQPGTLTANNTSLEILQNGNVATTLTNGVITGNTVCFTVNASDFVPQSGGFDFQVNATFGIGNGTQMADDTHTIPGQNNDYIFDNPDCCNDEPYISPYWQHPNCPEVVCTADQWPIHVLSSDGTPITTAGGIIISWDNLDTPTDENLIQDWIYASPLENWQATITYPNGCEYVVTYFEDCCDEEIFIKVLECPTDGQLQTYEASIKERMEARRAENRSEAQTQANTQTYAQMQDELDRLHLYMDARASSRGDDCDPCELGIVFIELVDADGNVINVNSYQSFSWSDGGAGAMRSFPLPMAGPVCFTATNIEYGKECVYQDCFFYECEEDPCEAPKDLQFDCRRAGMSWTGDPTLTYTIEVSWDDPRCCRSKYPPTAMRWEVTGTSFQLPYIKDANCFSWKVGVKCKDGIVWSESQCVYCYGPTKPHDDVPSDVKTQAKVYPNPNDGNMNIEISGNDKTTFALKVYRFDGTLIKTFNENRIENQSIKISWNGKNVLSKGMYFFVITTDKETITKKVVIE